MISFGSASDVPVADLPEKRLLRKNILLEELTRKHEDALHLLEIEIRNAERLDSERRGAGGRGHKTPMLNSLQQENAKLREQVASLRNELQVSLQDNEQLRINFEIQRLEIQKMQLQHSFELQQLRDRVAAGSSPRAAV
eukprot:NODE_4186_length_849_cov_16.520000_g3862_i0.p1 GENE.NODE_4186_length_849_cov_16.520000_g3862_i0~~NODE_4186_length_849_cov_16.520000_g3862_i0.p1  ORF type:complete len:139 (+),score=43.01 NODE_4186_length_849_cov_16.520000_g3862_i0:113-529(+)